MGYSMNEGLSCDYIYRNVVPSRSKYISQDFFQLHIYEFPHPHPRTQCKPYPPLTYWHYYYYHHHYCYYYHHYFYYYYYYYYFLYKLWCIPIHTARDRSIFSQYQILYVQMQYHPQAR